MDEMGGAERETCGSCISCRFHLFVLVSVVVVGKEVLGDPSEEPLGCYGYYR